MSSQERKLDVVPQLPPERELTPAELKRAIDVELIKVLPKFAKVMREAMEKAVKETGGHEKFNPDATEKSIGQMLDSMRKVGIPDKDFLEILRNLDDQLSNPQEVEKLRESIGKMAKDRLGNGRKEPEKPGEPAHKLDGEIKDLTPHPLPPQSLNLSPASMGDPLGAPLPTGLTLSSVRHV